MSRENGLLRCHRSAAARRVRRAATFVSFALLVVSLGGCPTGLSEDALRELVRDELSQSGGTVVNGANGVDGANGGTGINGSDGVNGANGLNGADGATGAQGAQGAPGAPGPAGAPGPSGPQGPAGSDGAAGAQGPQGQTGPAGPQGAAGPPGPSGAPGPDGAAGPQGPPGETGPQGAEGAPGPQGPQGPPGNDGAVGPPGPVGPQGPEGARGPRGFSCWDLNSNGIGDPWEDINGDTNFDAFDCQGVDGAPGTTGPPGPPGEPGQPGAPGQNGLSCWDLNGNGFADADEDANGDGQFNALDCQGSLANVSIGPGLVRDANDVLMLDTAYTDARYWRLGGNLGDGAANFLGHADDTPLILGANSAQILRLEYNAASPTVLAGHSLNQFGVGVAGAVIAGGGADDLGGGFSEPNTVSANFGVVGGGLGNTVDGFAGLVAGGRGNGAYGDYSAVLGGASNAANAAYSLALGGERNAASADYAVAAGRRAKANHLGAFVWADSTDADFSSARNNEFRVRALGGAHFAVSPTTNIEIRVNGNRLMSASNGAYLSLGGSWVNASDRELKENFGAVNTRGILDLLATVPIQSWNYIFEGAEVRRIGPMAQDFYAAFGLGNDDRHISTVDAEGVAFAAIQALYAIYGEQKQVIDQQHHRINALTTRVDTLTADNQALLTRLAALEERVRRLENEQP